MTPPRTDEQAQAALRALAIPYTARGGQQREALITVNATGVWFVYDLSTAMRAAGVGLLVQRLDGTEEELHEAVAVAAEFVANQVAYARGDRLDSPLPKTTQERLSKIRRDAQRAASAAASDTKTLLEPDWFQAVVTAATADPAAAGEDQAVIAA
jgi:hypothetical protein